MTIGQLIGVVLGICTVVGAYPTLKEWWMAWRLKKSARHASNVMPTLGEQSPQSPASPTETKTQSVRSATATRGESKERSASDVDIADSEVAVGIRRSQVLSIEEVVHTLGSNELTSLRKSHFAKQHNGRRVVWRCQLFLIGEGFRCVSGMVMPIGDFGIYVVDVKFPERDTPLLLALNSYDEILIEGDLRIEDETPRLENCSLIRIISRKKKTGS